MGSKTVDKGAMTPDMQELADRLGRRLVALRDGLRLTQEEVAGRVGLSTSYISMLERGQRIPHLGVLTDLARVLRTDMLSLLASETAGPDTLSRPLVSFVHEHALTTTEVDKLLSMARLMFPHRPGEPS